MALNYDTAYALAWGRATIGGALPDYQAYGAPTPHPLLTAVAGMAAVVGRHAYVALPLLGCLAWALLLASAFRLGREIASAATGALAAAVLGTSWIFAGLAATAAKDVPYVALLLAAAVLAVRGRRMPVALLLVLAGLLRPEAWLLSALWWVHLVRTTPAAGERIAHLAVAAAAPAIWTASDLIVTGDPLFSFTFTRDLGAELGRPTGIDSAAAALARDLPDLVTWPVVVGGIAGAVQVIRSGRRGSTVLVGLLGAALGAFALQGAVGLPLTGRLLLAAAAVLAILFAVVTTDLLRHPRPAARILGVVAIVALLAALPSHVARYRDLRTELRVEGRVYGDLRALLHSPAGDRARGCARTVLLPGLAPSGMQIAYAAYSLHGGRFEAVGTALTGPGSAAILRSPAGEPGRPAGEAAEGLPPGFGHVRTNRTWSIFTRGC